MNIITIITLTISFASWIVCFIVVRKYKTARETKEEDDYQKILQNAISAISSTIEYDKILKLIEELLNKVIGITIVSLINYNKNKYTFSEMTQTANRLLLKLDHPLIRLLKRIQIPVFLSDIYKWQKNIETKQELNLINISNSDLDIIKNDLQSRKFIGVLPLIAKQQLVGILAIGPKKNDKAYTAEDIKLLHNIASQLTIAVENVSLYQDVKETKEAIKEQLDNIETIINNLTDGLIVTDKNKNIILANPVAKKMFPNCRLIDEELPDILKQKITQRATVKIDVDIPLGQQIQTRCETEFPLISDITIEKPNKIAIRVITSPIFDQNNNQTGYIKILHDITRDKEIDKIKSDFIRIAAHKLRTPLSVTKWIFCMLIDGDLGQMDPKQKEFLEKGYQSNERMVRVVNDLLNVSEIEHGKFNFNFEETQITDIIEKAINELKSLWLKKNQELTYNLDKTIRSINADRYKIKMAIDALILNAIQYTKKGGRINIKLEKIDQKIKFTITDNGYGIPISQQDKIFTKYMRGDNIAQIETEGNGLGLYIAKNIIEGHRGTIGFSSKQDEGSTFFFILPT